MVWEQLYMQIQFKKSHQRLSANHGIGSSQSGRYSTARKAVNIFSGRVHAERVLKDKFDMLNSQFKVCPHSAPFFVKIKCNYSINWTYPIMVNKTIYMLYSWKII